MKKYAFWKYDSFPYVLGGIVSFIHDDGLVEIESFGKGYSFSPVLICSEKEGKQIQKKLDSLEQERSDMLRSIKTLYNHRLKSEFPDKLTRHLSEIHFKNK